MMFGTSEKQQRHHPQGPKPSCPSWLNLFSRMENIEVPPSKKCGSMTVTQVATSGCTRDSTTWTSPTPHSCCTLTRRLLCSGEYHEGVPKRICFFFSCARIGRVSCPPWRHQETKHPVRCTHYHHRPEHQVTQDDQKTHQAHLQCHLVHTRRLPHRRCHQHCWTFSNVRHLRAECTVQALDDPLQC